MSEMERFKQTFFQECTELLSELEERFGEITQGQGGMEAAQAVFRAVHSIKGGAGAFGFADLVGFAHVLEALLDDIRNGKKHFTPEIILICLRSCDGLADLLANARDGIKGMSPAVAQAKAALEDLQGSKASAGAPDSFEDLEFQPVQMAINAPADDAAPGQWIITFRPLPALYQRANEPLFIFQELANLGPLEVECHVLDAPPLAQFDPLDVLLHWTLRLETSAARSQIEAAFDFCDGDCQLEITEPAPAPASEELSLEALLAQTQVKPAVLPAPPLPVPAEGATDIAGASRAAPNLAAQTIRVDLDRVDRVADMTGELVIAQAMITGQIDARLRMDYPDLVRGLETLAQHTRMLQDSIMAIRAQPVKAVFARVPRLLRELASVTGKKVRLETEGENTEIDRTVIEQLNDPLTHMIRNAMDHGIETPEQRRAAGKREEGLIRLSAEQASGRIIIRFRHNDMKDLAHRLERLEGTPGNRIIVAEGIYSMLGDRAPLAEMIAIKKRFGAYLVLDEAHSVGVLGPSGRGLAEELGLLDDVDVLTGTFSKSFGTVGGFCVSSLPDFEVMRVVCRPYMFAASLPPAVIASTSAALRALQTTPALRLRLWRNIPVLYNGLRAAGFSVGPHEGPIVAVAAGKGRDLAVHTWRQLLEAGYYVNLALSPATPGGISLLRCSVSAAHSVEQLQGLVDALTQIAHGNGLLPAPMAAMAAG